MPYSQCRIYNDGSHFIGIIPTECPRAKRRKIREDLIEVERIETGEKEMMTKREYFNKLYKEKIDLGKSKIVDESVKAMQKYFKSEEETTDYVYRNMKRKKHNMVVRKIRLLRKTALQEFNYFCTFTYDSKKHSEESFKKKLRHTFSNMCYRRGWKYVGVWELSPEKKRLHFHGLFYIPDGQMVGELIEVRDYDTRRHCMQDTVQNTYFNKRFGRSDFEKIDSNSMLDLSVNYIMKYLEKTGEKIVYSKNLPQYFVSDILDEDVLCITGDAGDKLLLYDNFNCINEGMIVGEVSKKTIAKMPKMN